MMATSSDTNKGKAGEKEPAVDIGFQLQYKRQEELKTATYDYNVVAPETRTHAPNGFFSALLSDTEKERHLREIDLNDRFFEVLDSDISTTADFEALDLRALVVDLQYGGIYGKSRGGGKRSVHTCEEGSGPFSGLLPGGELLVPIQAQL